MKPGISRFNYFFTKLQPLLTAAASQKNPALWLYRNDARTPIFMLEALAKMYAEFHNKKKFTRIREHFKLVEDALGAIDYYDSMARDLANNKKVPPPVIAYLQAQSREKMQSLNEILAENDWLTLRNNRLVKIQGKLENADWLDEKEEADRLIEFYGESIYKIVEFTERTNFRFTDMETEVHELRRKMRWLSIYPQALRGTVQLGITKPVPKHLKKYEIAQITTSPFNKMPEAGGAKYLVLLEQHHFYSLSWMIAELGKIKDTGLHIVALKEAIQQTSQLSDEAAMKKTYQVLGNKQPKMEELLDTAATTCKTFFKEQNLEHIVIGIKAAN